MDFLHYYGLLMDVRHNRPVDPIDNKVAKTSPTVDLAIPIFSVSRDHLFKDMLKQFPGVTGESPVPKQFLYEVEHELYTSGPRCSHARDVCHRII